MENLLKFYISENEKDNYIEALCSELTVLRTKAEISQEELACIIGISRQTYGAIERKTRRMTWTTYLSFLMFYDNNKRTHSYLRNSPAFPHEIFIRFNDDKSFEHNIKNLLVEIDDSIFDSLDEQAYATIKSIIMVEYARCNPVSAEVALKFFGGSYFNKEKDTQEIIRMKKAINNIKMRDNQ